MYYSLLMGLSADIRVAMNFDPLTADELALLRLEDTHAPGTDSERHRQVARALAQKALTAMVLYLGETEALRLWAQTVKPQCVRRRGARRQQRDAELLHFYDHLLGRGMPVRALPGFLGKQLGKPTFHGEYGPSAEAIAKHVRRLVGQRAKLQEAVARLPTSPAAVEAATQAIADK